MSSPSSATATAAMMQQAATQVPDLSNLPPICDGFTYNASIAATLPYSYHRIALDSMEILRRGKFRRFHVFVVPDDFNEPIPAYAEVDMQIRLIPDSFVWGVSCLELNGIYQQAAAVDFVVQITEACNNVDLFYEFITGDSFSYGTTAANWFGFPHLLTQPRLITAPGLLNVKVSNRLSTPLTCQLLIHVAEPAIREGVELDMGRNSLYGN